MGLLNALFGRNKSNVRTEHDRVWMTSATKFAELAYEVAHRAANQPAAILLVAFFEESEQSLHEISAESYPVPVKVANAANLNPAAAAAMELGTASLDIICCERHPSYETHQRVLEFAEALNCPCNLICHLSFEDALVRRLVDPQLIKSLGVRDTESVQSGMITRRIRRAQQQVDAKIGSKPLLHAATAEAWFEANCPDMKPVRT